MEDSNGQNAEPNVVVTFLESDNFNIQVTIRDANPLQLWAVARWIERYADAMNDAQLVQRAQAEQHSIIQVARSIDGGLKRT